MLSPDEARVLLDDGANDNAAATRHGPAPDQHGRAAYLLVESLLHELVARAAITHESAIRAVDIAADTGAALASDGEERPEQEAVAILRTLAVSLRTDQAPDLI